MRDVYFKTYGPAVGFSAAKPRLPLPSSPSSLSPPAPRGSCSSTGCGTSGLSTLKASGTDLPSDPHPGHRDQPGGPWNRYLPHEVTPATPRGCPTGRVRRVAAALFSAGRRDPRPAPPRRAASPVPVATPAPAPAYPRGPPASPSLLVGSRAPPRCPIEAERGNAPPLPFADRPVNAAGVLLFRDPVAPSAGWRTTAPRSPLGEGPGRATARSPGAYPRPGASP